MVGKAVAEVAEDAPGRIWILGTQLTGIAARLDYLQAVRTIGATLGVATGSDLQLHPVLREWLQVISPSALRDRLATSPPDVRARLEAALKSDLAVLVLDGLPTTVQELVLDVLRQLAETDRDLRFMSVEAGPVGSAEIAASDWSARLADQRLAPHAFFSPDGQLIASVEPDGSVTIWNVHGKLMSRLFSPPAPLMTAAFDASGTSLLTTTSRGTVLVWDLRTADVRLDLRGRSQDAVQASFGFDDASIVTAHTDGLVTVWNAESGRPRFSVPGRWVSARSYLGNFVAGSTDSGLDVWDMTGGGIRLRTHLPGILATQSADGQHIATADASGEFNLWDPASGHHMLRSRTPAPVTHLSFSPDSSSLLVGSTDERVYVWDVTTGQARFDVAGHAARFSSSGASLVVMSSDQGARVEVRDAQTGAQHLARDGQDAVFAPGGQRLMIQGEDRVTRVWHVPSSSQMVELEGTQARVSPTGHHVLTTLADGTPKLWEVEPATGLVLRGHMLRAIGPIAAPTVLARATEAAIQPPEIVERYAEVRAPDRVPAGDSFEIAASLLMEKTADTGGQPISTVVTVGPTGMPTGASPIVVVLYASEAFIVDGESSQKLEIYADRDSGPAIFRLTARSDVHGQQHVGVGFLQGWQYLAHLDLTISIDDAPDPEQVHGAPIHAQGTPPDGGSDPQSAPAIVLNIGRTIFDHQDRLEFSYQWFERGEELRDAGKRPLGRHVEAILAERFEQLSAFARRDPAQRPQTPDGPERELEKIGENLYFELFSDELKSFIKQIWNDAEGKTIQINSQEPWIPWEMIKPFDLGGARSEFLCSRFQVSRWLPGSSGAVAQQTIKVRKIGFIQGYNLPAVQQELAYLTSLPGVWPPVRLYQPMPSAAREVLLLISLGEAHVLHFATHGSLPSGDVPLADILIAPDDRLRVSDIIGDPIVDGLHRSAPMVFMNACHTGRQALSLSDQVTGWTERFLSFGSSAFIGANWEVDDELAAMFAREVYEALRAGSSLAAAVRTARAVLRQAAPTNSTWLAYSLYSHPNGHVLPA
jgi:WD40 repeat protein